MSAITELQRQIRERADLLDAYRVTYSCGHLVLCFGDWRQTCSICRQGTMRVVFKP